MLSLELDNNHEFVDDNVLALLQKCKKLNQLTLNANVVVSTIRAICLLRSEKKTSKYNSIVKVPQTRYDR